MSASVDAHLGTTGLTTTLHARQHRFTGDEPPEKGGQDQGPTPYELVLGGLATCTAVTLRMYAERKGWPLAGVDVHVEMDAGPEGRAAVRRRLTFAGPLDDAQRERLLQIANACPVHKLLSRGADIETALAPAG